MNGIQSYLKHWQARHPVFLGQVATENLYIPETYEPLVQRGVVFAQQPGGGLIVWAGSRGSGRSSLCKYVYQSIDLVTTEPLLLTMVQDEDEAGWLIARLVKLFCPTSKHKARGKSATNAFKDLANNFERVLGEGRGLAIFIDAAEHLRSAAALADIAALLNLQSLAAGRISISLFGTEQTAELCKKSQATASRTLCHLAIPAFDPNHLAGYIEHRCKLAGMPGSCFEPTTFTQLWSLSGGNVSRVNSLAENCLMEAARMRLTAVNLKAIIAASQFLDTTRPTAKPVHTPDEAPPPPPGTPTVQPLASLFRVPPPQKPPGKGGR